MTQAIENAVRYFRRHRSLYGDQLVLGAPVVAIEPPPASRVVADQVATLAAFNEEIRNCQKCPLGATRTEFVFGVGNPDADLVFIGEAPGAQEDLQGEPFVGRAGKLLDQILAAIELSRRDVYILNVLKCRPPGNRDPQPPEVEQCEPYLQEQLRIIQPKLIVTLGRVAAKTLLRVDESLQKMRKQVYRYQGVEVRTTYHPAALLRNPGWKAPAWEDFQVIRDRYRELTGQLPVVKKGDQVSTGKGM